MRAANCRGCRRVPCKAVLSEKALIRSASLLAGSTIIAKIIGACYRIPLTNILGAEGMGVYQLVFPVFALLLTLSSGAIPSAIAILISQKRTLGEDTSKLFHSAFIVLTMFGLAVTLGLIALSKPLSLLQANVMTASGYIVIAPSIVFVSVISVFRGFFMGHKNMLPPAISQISESVIKLIVGLLLARLLIKRGLETAVLGALLGVTASELVTMLLLFFMYRDKQGLTGGISAPEMKGHIKEIAAIAVPLTLGGIIIPLSLFLDSLLIVNLLKSGLGINGATTDYGLWSGTVSPLINLPIVLSLSLGVAVVPLLSEGKAQRNLSSITTKTAMCLKLALIIGAPFIILFLFLAEEVLGLLYPVLAPAQLQTAAMLMRIESLNMLALSVGQITASVLQALGKTSSPVKALSVCVALKIILNIVLLPLIGIKGAAIASVTGFGIYAAINLSLLRNLIGKNPAMIKNISLISVCGVIMSVIIFGFGFVGVSRVMWIAAPLAALAYLLSLFALRVFDSAEIDALPLSRLWRGIDRIFGRKNVINE